MDLKITDLITQQDYMPPVYGSVAMYGDNAEELTWNNAKKQVTESPFNLTPEQIDHVKDYFQDYGAWSKEEIAGWSTVETEALLLQDIMSEISELEMYDTIEEYEQGSKEGTVKGSISQDDDGEYYIYIGH